MEKFSDWITRMFVEWQAKQGKRKRIEDFAVYLGISRPLLNMWMNSNRKPGAENIKLLAEIFGNDVYDVLGIKRPNIYLQNIERSWNTLPEYIQKKIADEVAQYITEKDRKNE